VTENFAQGRTKAGEVLDGRYFYRPFLQFWEKWNFKARKGKKGKLKEVFFRGRWVKKIRRAVRYNRFFWSFIPSANY